MFCWPHLSTAPPYALCTCAQPLGLAYNVGKGRQQAQGADILRDADAARGVCALQSSSLDYIHASQIIIRIYYRKA
jgi:hypothetical protein